MLYLDLVSDDVYRKIMGYLYQPRKEVRRWLPEQERWNPEFFTNQCHRCGVSAQDRALSHECKVCPCQYMGYEGKRVGVCNNLLICRECADLPDHE